MDPALTFRTIFFSWRQTHKMEDHPLSPVRNCLLNIFATNCKFHIWRPSFSRRQPDEAPAVLTRDPLNTGDVMDIMGDFKIPLFHLVLKGLLNIGATVTARPCLLVDCGLLITDNFISRAPPAVQNWVRRCWPARSLELSQHDIVAGIL
jgi:hypothetical protein